MAQLWKKSILLEIYDTKSNVPLYSYALTVPPESYELTIPQRVTRTKTFGGVFIDDYGVDNAKLTISGSTGGVTVRPTFSTRPYPLGIDGRDAIFILRDEIALYKEKYLTGTSDLVIRVYDLSSFQVGVFGTITSANKVLFDAFECSLDDFKISRNKDKPLWYNYSIEFFVIRRLGTYKQPLRLPFIDVDSLLDIVEWFKGNNQSWFRQISDFFNLVFGVSNAIDSLWNGLVREVDNYQTAIEAWITGTVGIGVRIGTYPAAIANAVLKSANRIKNFVVSGFQNVLENMTDDLVAEYEEVVDNANKLVGMGQSFVVAGKEIANENGAPAIMGGEQSVISEAAGTENTEGINQEITGSLMTKATSSTTFERLAVQYYGDARYALLIAQYNNLADIDEIEPGMPLTIPILNNAEARSTNNQIFSYDRTDPYGTDIALSADGGMLWGDGGDVGPVDSSENLKQAITSRLAETLGANTRLTAYGIMTNVGSPNEAIAPAAYLVSSIVDTAKQDPRVLDVQNISIEGAGDSLYYTFDILAVGGDNISVTGSL